MTRKLLMVMEMNCENNNVIRHNKESNPSLRPTAGTSSRLKYYCLIEAIIANSGSRLDSC